jgi:hypothetical protein
MLEGSALEIAHHGETVKLSTEHPVSRPIPKPPPSLEPPTQPRGRAPARRRTET